MPPGRGYPAGGGRPRRNTEHSSLPARDVNPENKQVRARRLRAENAAGAILKGKERRDSAGKTRLIEGAARRNKARVAKQRAQRAKRIKGQRRQGQIFASENARRN